MKNLNHTVKKVVYNVGKCTEVKKMEQMKRLLASIGKKSFVEFYEDYQLLYEKGKNLTKEDKNKLAEKL
jgi:hypothetical protein